MLRNHGKRGLRLGVGLALAAAATGVWAGGEAEQAAAGSSAESGYTLPIVEPGSVTLSYAGWEHPVGFGDGPVWQRIYEDTGVTVDWQVVPGNDYASFIKTRIAAAVDLPDVMSLGWNNAVGSPVDLHAQGATIKLTELVNQYAPNIKRLMEEFTAVRPYLVAPDGDIYATAARTVPPISNYKNWYVREDWLERLDWRSRRVWKSRPEGVPQRGPQRQRRAGRGPAGPAHVVATGVVRPKSSPSDLNSPAAGPGHGRRRRGKGHASGGDLQTGRQATECCSDARNWPSETFWDQSGQPGKWWRSGSDEGGEPAASCLAGPRPRAVRDAWVGNRAQLGDGRLARPASHSCCGSPILLEPRGGSFGLKHSPLIALAML